MERWDVFFKAVTTSAGALFGFIWGVERIATSVACFVIIDYFTGYWQAVSRAS